MSAEQPLILVTGATGYVGGRLVPRLVSAGYRVRCLARDPQRLQGRPWESQVEIVAGDALHPESLARALAGVSMAYYLIHSLKMENDDGEREILAAANFGQAARVAGVERIIYMSGLGDPETMLYEHIRCWRKSGEALRQSGVQVIEFRASMIVGSGSLAFEIMRYLTERLPVVFCPPLVYTRAQPIALADMLDYLLAALRVEAGAQEIVEVGGADILTYREMMLCYARLRGLKRILIPLHVPTPLLFSKWIFIDSPVSATLARPHVLSLRYENIVHSDLARRLFPAIEPMKYCQAVQLALDELEAGLVETTWSDALSTTQGDLQPVRLVSYAGMLVEQRQIEVNAPAAQVFRAFTALGGSRGWLYLNWVWQIRGVIDLIFGGVGLRRGRRSPDEVRIGDALDFWRVEAVEPDRLLRLRAEMKVPGRAWLQFQVQPLGANRSLLLQTAYFVPKGLAGILYWYLLYPVHSLIFRGMIRRIARGATNPIKQ